MLYKYVEGWLKKGGGRQEFEGRKNPDSTKLINIEQASVLYMYQILTVQPKPPLLILDYSDKLHSTEI